MRKKSIRTAVFSMLLVALLAYGQQCSNVNLERYEEISFLSLGANPLRLNPPFDYPQVRRFIFFVDMSNSMVSGPCIQDVDESIGFSTSPSYMIYDPNKGTGNPNDHRGSGIDCKVNRLLPINRTSIVNNQPDLSADPPVFFQTHAGNDYLGDRFAILRNWLNHSLQTNSPLLIGRTKVMLIPFSGGISQATLTQRWKDISQVPSLSTFFDLNDPRLFRLIDWMEKEHRDNLALAEGDLLWRYKDRTMGTSAPGALLPQIYESVQVDMRALNNEGKLSFTDYQMIQVGDGLLTPLAKNIEDTLRFYAPCSSCAGNPKSCSTTCKSVVQRLYDAWGYPEDNSSETLDFYYGLLQSLPFYFGSGYLRLDFVQMHKERVEAAHPGRQTIFETLPPLFEKRATKLKEWNASTQQPPFRLMGDTEEAATYKVTNFFVLNSNVRLKKTGSLGVDSDGDGLFDDEEAAYGLNPSVARTNGYCLDSFMSEPAFRDRCMALAQAKSCDPKLDSDGDSLNECEEMLLGTDAFDFDTDGDAIPDYFEWLYGFNPLYSDEKLDSNGDGFLNLLNFASGMGPHVRLGEVRPETRANYEVNFHGKEEIVHEAVGHVFVDLYEIIVHSVPTLGGAGSSIAAQKPLYASRVGNDVNTIKNNEIPFEQQLRSVLPSPERNMVTALARMVDTSNPDRVYWRILKTEIPISSIYKQPRLDLSLFKQLRALDRSNQ